MNSFEKIEHSTLTPIQSTNETREKKTTKNMVLTCYANELARLAKAVISGADGCKRNTGVKRFCCAIATQSRSDRK